MFTQHNRHCCRLALQHSPFFVLLFILSISGFQSARANDFDSFPLNQPVYVNFEIDIESFSQLNARSQRAQMLDWLFFTVLSDAGLSDQELSHVLFDLPPTRQGFMHPVANFEFGLTRSRIIENGEVIALIPAGLTPVEDSETAETDEGLCQGEDAIYIVYAN